jgi:hypothetical protein
VSVKPDAAARTDDVSPRAVLELHVAEMKQLFNAMDPAPFRERDLDPNAQAYIVEWAREIRATRALHLVVHLGREPATPENTTLLSDAVHAYFRHRALATRRQLRQLFRDGRTSLLIGLVFLALAIMAGEVVASNMDNDHHGWIVRETFALGGWVALWRPLEIFLYDWWPILAQAKLLDRLSEMGLSVHGTSVAATSVITT